jgi:hypothetical protein
MNATHDSAGKRTNAVDFTYDDIASLLAPKGDAEPLAVAHHLVENPELKSCCGRCAASASSSLSSKPAKLRYPEAASCRASICWPTSRSFISLTFKYLGKPTPHNEFVSMAQKNRLLTRAVQFRPLSDKPLARRSSVFCSHGYSDRYTAKGKVSGTSPFSHSAFRSRGSTARVSSKWRTASN